MKYLPLLGLFVIKYSDGFSQNSKVIYGIHTGMNISGLHVVNNGMTANYRDKTGFIGGVDLEIPILSDFFLQPELSYSEMGATYKVVKGVPHLAYKENYLILPVLVKYHIKGTRISGYIGPQYGYLLHSSSETKDGMWLTISNYSSKSDFSGILGGEYYLRNGIGLSVRYQMGLIDVAKKEYVGSDGCVRNHGFSFLLGYRF